MTGDSSKQSKVGGIKKETIYKGCGHLDRGMIKLFSI